MANDDRPEALGPFGRGGGGAGGAGRPGAGGFVRGGSAWHWTPWANDRPRRPELWRQAVAALAPAVVLRRRPGGVRRRPPDLECDGRDDPTQGPSSAALAALASQTGSGEASARRPRSLEAMGKTKRARYPVGPVEGGGGLAARLDPRRRASKRLRPPDQTLDAMGKRTTPWPCKLSRAGALRGDGAAGDSTAGGRGRPPAGRDGGDDRRSDQRVAASPRGGRRRRRPRRWGDGRDDPACSWRGCGGAGGADGVRTQPPPPAR